MPLPRVAIVGRPNVGKSSLMNLVAGAKVSIVDPTPGVTRDRVSAIVELDPPIRSKGALEHGPKKPVELIDTGGFGVYVAEGKRFDERNHDLAKLTGSIEAQIALAVESADLVLFIIDAQAGVTPADRQIAQMLREGSYGKRRTRGAKSSAKRPAIRVVANKVDGPRWESHAAEVADLGLGEPLSISAKNNYMRREFLESLYELVPLASPDDAPEPADLFFAIIGKRNAGKSTLVNTLAGEERVIASEIPGTTRDAVDVRFELEGKTLVAIDTAGLRRKRSFQDLIEHFAFDRLQRSIDRADVVLLLVDSTEPISQVDEHLAQLVQASFKPCVICVNKWDLAEGRRDPRGKPVTSKTYETYVREELRGLWFAPIAFMTGSTGRNVRQTLALAIELREQSRQRVTTGKLNRLIRGILDTRGPSDIRGRFAKVYYVAQTGVEPPTITMVVNHPGMFTPNYLRFLSNRFREELPYTEVPIRIVVRARRQREDDLVSADEGGEGATIRISRGRKGVKQRLTGTRMLAEGPEGDDWLSDEHSEPVDLHDITESDDADDYFDDDESPSPRVRKASREPSADAGEEPPEKAPAKPAKKKRAPKK